MRILTTGIKAAKHLLTRQRLKRTERQLVREIRMAHAELDIHPDRSVHYAGEIIPDLSMRLAAVRAQLRKSPYEGKCTLGNVHGRAASSMPAPATTKHSRVTSCAATMAPESGSATSGGLRCADASPAMTPSPGSSHWDSAKLTRAAC